MTRNRTLQRQEFNPAQAVAAAAGGTVTPRGRVIGARIDRGNIVVAIDDQDRTAHDKITRYDAGAAIGNEGRIGFAVMLGHVLLIDAVAELGRMLSEAKELAAAIYQYFGASSRAGDGNDVILEPPVGPTEIFTIDAQGNVRSLTDEIGITKVGLWEPTGCLVAAVKSSNYLYTLDMDDARTEQLFIRSAWQQVGEPFTTGAPISVPQRMQRKDLAAASFRTTGGFETADCQRIGEGKIVFPPDAQFTGLAAEARVCVLGTVDRGAMLLAPIDRGGTFVVVESDARRAVVAYVEQVG